jgi:glycosyl transferase family 25
MNMLPTNWICFVINLGYSAQRMSSISTQLTRAGISFHRFEAVDGHNIDPDNHPFFDRKRYETRHGKEPSPNEIGCFMSHLGVMKSFLASDADHCLVLEDDAIVDPSLVSILRELEMVRNDWDITLLYGNHSGGPCYLRALGRNHHLAGFFFRQTGAVAYAINRKAARTYIDKLLPMSLPIDVDYDRVWDFSIRFRGVLPFPVKTGHYPSDIGKTGRKFIWYRRLGAYLCRIELGAQRFTHYTFVDPIWLKEIKLRLAAAFANFRTGISTIRGQRLW